MYYLSVNGSIRTARIVYVKEATEKEYRFISKEQFKFHLSRYNGYYGNPVGPFKSKLEAKISKAQFYLIELKLTYSAKEDQEKHSRKTIKFLENGLKKYPEYFL